MPGTYHQVGSHCLRMRTRRPVDWYVGVGAFFPLLGVPAGGGDVRECAQGHYSLLEHGHVGKVFGMEPGNSMFQKANE